jgi:hypothetical protein
MAWTILPCEVLDAIKSGGVDERIRLAATSCVCVDCSGMLSPDNVNRSTPGEIVELRGGLTEQPPDWFNRFFCALTVHGVPQRSVVMRLWLRAEP